MDAIVPRRGAPGIPRRSAPAPPHRRQEADEAEPERRARPGGGAPAAVDVAGSVVRVGRADLVTVVPPRDAPTGDAQAHDLAGGPDHGCDDLYTAPTAARVYACTPGPLLVSADGRDGATAGEGPLQAPATLGIDPAYPDRLRGYAAEGVVTTEDGGVAWTERPFEGTPAGIAGPPRPRPRRRRKAGYPRCVELLLKFIDVMRNLDEYLDGITQQYGTWTYAILGLVIFVETGLVIMPFLPGDSLLFAAGAIAMRDESGLDPLLLGALLIVCAIAGDTVNYHVGKAIGPRVMTSETSRWLNKKHLERTHRFFEKYGGKTIILARFVPIVRTFAPFVAGAGAMHYQRFILFNVVGAIAWVTSMMGAGMLFGQMQVVKENFELVVLGIIFVSILPMVVEAWKARAEGQAAA